MKLVAVVVVGWVVVVEVATLEDKTVTVVLRPVVVDKLVTVRSTVVENVGAGAVMVIVVLNGTIPKQAQPLEY
jgi:hypothetical protein